MQQAVYGYDQPPQYNPTQGQPMTAGGVVPVNQEQAKVPPQDKEHYGYDQPPQYTQQSPASPTQVVVQNQFGQPAGGVILQQPASQTIIVTAPIRPPTYMWLSCLVYWCCNWLFGGIAFVLSMIATTSADENRLEESRRYGRASLYTSLAGIAVTVILLIILGIVVGASSSSTD